MFGHWDVVTCLAYSDDDLTATNAIIVSGSSDATVLVWIWDQKAHRVMGPANTTGLLLNMFKAIQFQSFVSSYISFLLKSNYKPNNRSYYIFILGASWRNSKSNLSCKLQGTYV